VADQPTRLCIVSRDRLRRGAFIAALQTSLSPEDDVQIIVDRRHGGSSRESDVKEDRRRQPQVDLALEANGFAIVPVSVEPEGDKNSFSPLFPVVSIERPSPQDAEGDEWFERVRSFRRWGAGVIPEFRRWCSGVIPELIGVLSGVTLAALVLSLAGQFIGRNLIGELFTGSLSSGPGGSPGATNERFTSAHLSTVTEESLAPENRPARTETPPSALPTNESSSLGGAASPKSVSPRDADRPTPRQNETSGPSKLTDSASREPDATSKETGASPKETSALPRSASTRAYEAGAPPEAGAGRDASIGRTRSSAAARPSPSASAPSNQVASAPSPAVTSNAAPQFAASHRAELVRGPVSRGWGDSYIVRVVDPAGRPMVAFDILLVAQMADGTVEKSPMGALPERGTYRATVPTSRSTPVDLRIRVSTGEKFVEVPVRR
jgi:hypothetical protein